MTVVEILAFIPSVICHEPSEDEDDIETEISIDNIRDFYKDDLPSPNLLETESVRWKIMWRAKWDHLEEDKRPATCASTLKSCDKLLFPNIYTLLKIICTMPATSCECERSASVMRHLHSYCRASMGQTRLSSLALIHTNYDYMYDKTVIVDRFVALKRRRVVMTNMFGVY